MIVAAGKAGTEPAQGAYWWDATACNSYDCGERNDGPLCVLCAATATNRYGDQAAVRRINRQQMYCCPDNDQTPPEYSCEAGGLPGERCDR